MARQNKAPHAGGKRTRRDALMRRTEVQCDVVPMVGVIGAA